LSLAERRGSAGLPWAHFAAIWDRFCKSAPNYGNQPLAGRGQMLQDAGMTDARHLMAGLFAAGLCTASHGQIHTISTATDTFVPSFRQAENTTYFGWEPGSFDGGLDNELMENPPPSLGRTLCLAGSLDQIGVADILAGSNNIYIGANGRSEALSFSIPTKGLPGSDDFTTIIIQGLTLAGAPASNTIGNYPVFGAIEGIPSAFVMGLNANAPAPGRGQGQWE
jgi:hypothetical protein